MEANNRSRPISNGMDIYFVRHGQTGSNARRVHQYPNTPLTALGREQALSAAEHLRAMNIDCIVTSDYKRAQETSSIIGNVLSISPIQNPLFHEIRRPAKLYSKSHFHPLTVWYVIETVLRRGNPGWHYDDAENLPDVRKRVHEALMFLESLGENKKSIAVVSHTIFINLLVAYMCKNRVLDLRDLVPHLLHVLTMRNGGVLHLKHNEAKNECGCAWQLEHAT